jgi:hypothetical protein
MSQTGMSATHQSCRAVVLIKALPQPSKTYGETVCCAGITADGQWKRLFPVRFRHLGGAASFSRWDWVRFAFRKPTRDTRAESCHVYEDTIELDGNVPPTERSRLLTPLIRKSAKDAMSLGHSLTLVQPKNTKFIAKLKTKSELEDEREAYRQAAKQGSIFDKELAELEPSCVYRKLDSAIMVVKAAEDRLRCDGADALNRAMKRGVLVQRSMSPRLIIIGGICAEDSAQVRFTEHDHVVQALPADRANEPLDICILPG